MVTDTSATMREEAPHATETSSTISTALRRRAHSIMSDIWIDREWRAVIRYALETNDPCLADLVRRADDGEVIIDTIDLAQTPGITANLASEDLSIDDLPADDKISTLCEIICQADDKSAAALFVLMGTIENSRDPKIIANTAKHFAFARCVDLNLYGIVDSQIDLVAAELLTNTGFPPDLSE